MNGSKNSRYLHHTTQNEIIHTLSTMTLNKISMEIKESMYFAGIADEIIDVSKTEQLLTAVKYYFQGELKENF